MKKNISLYLTTIAAITIAEQDAIADPSNQQGEVEAIISVHPETISNDSETIEIPPYERHQKSQHVNEPYNVFLVPERKNWGRKLTHKPHVGYRPPTFAELLHNLTKKPSGLASSKEYCKIKEKEFNLNSCDPLWKAPRNYHKRKF